MSYPKSYNLKADKRLPLYKREGGHGREETWGAQGQAVSVRAWTQLQAFAFWSSSPWLLDKISQCWDIGCKDFILVPWFPMKERFFPGREKFFFLPLEEKCKVFWLWVGKDRKEKWSYDKIQATKDSVNRKKSVTLVVWLKGAFNLTTLGSHCLRLVPC